MGASATIKAALGLPGTVAGFEKRLLDVDADTVSAAAEKTRAEAELHGSEKRGDTKAADSAAAALAAVEGKLARLRARHVAVTAGLEEAQAAKALAENAERVEALKAAQAKAAKQADAAHVKAVELVLSLGDTFKEFLAAARAENAAIDELAREGGDFFAHHQGGRGILRIEEAAKKARSWSERVEILVPIPL
jgi:hypothetical protein